MITAKLQVSLDRLYELKKELSKNQLNRAYSAAINRSLSHGLSVLKREIRNQYRVKSSLLNGFPIFKANPNKLEGYIKAKTHPLSLAHFNPVHEYTSGGANWATRVRTTKDGLTKTIRQKKRGAVKKGVSFEVKKGNRVSLPYAFMTKNDNEKPVFFRGSYKVGSSNYGIVRRNKRVVKKGSDLPIAKILTVSLYGTAVNKNVSGRLDLDLSAYLMKRLEHELRFRLSKVKGA